MQMGLTFERVEAIKGGYLREAEKRKVNPRRFWRRAVTDAEIGCYLSHLKVIRIIAERKLSRAIILEDDVIFESDFAQFADGSLAIPQRFDILKLSGHDFRRRKVLNIAACGTRMLSFVTPPTFGAAAYLITLSGAIKAIEQLTVIRSQFDSDFFRYWQTGLHTLDILPYPAHQDGSKSTMEDRARIIPLTRKQERLLKISRRPVKRMEKIMRVIFQLRYFGLSAFNSSRIVRPPAK